LLARLKEEGKTAGRRGDSLGFVYADVIRLRRGKCYD
jgi:hypothetical protein